MSLLEIAQRNAYERQQIDCLILNVDGSRLVVPDEPLSRENAIAMIFGQPPYDPTERPESVIVSRCTRTRAQLDDLPEWEP